MGNLTKDQLIGWAGLILIVAGLVIVIGSVLVMAYQRWASRRTIRGAAPVQEPGWVSFVKWLIEKIIALYDQGKLALATIILGILVIVLGILLLAADTLTGGSGGGTPTPTPTATPASALLTPFF